MKHYPDETAWVDVIHAVPCVIGAVGLVLLFFKRTILLGMVLSLVSVFMIGGVLWLDAYNYLP